MTLALAARMKQAGSQYGVCEIPRDRRRGHGRTRHHALPGVVGGHFITEALAGKSISYMAYSAGSNPRGEPPIDFESIGVFPDIDRVASLGIGPEIVAFPAADITDPGRAAEVEREALTKTIADTNIVVRDSRGRVGLAPEERGL